MKLYVIKTNKKKIMNNLQVGQTLKIINFVGKIVHISRPPKSHGVPFVTGITVLDEEDGVLVNIYTHASGRLTAVQRSSTTLSEVRVTTSDLKLVNGSIHERIVFCLDDDNLKYETISECRNELIENGTILKYTLDEKECIVLYISEQGNIICKELNSDKEIVIGVNDVRMQLAFNITRNSL